MAMIVGPAEPTPAAVMQGLGRGPAGHFVGGRARPAISDTARAKAGQQTIGFGIFVEDEFRTCGVALIRPGHDSADLAGLDLAELTVAASSEVAAAQGKIAILGRDGVSIFQSKSGLRPQPVWCGNATACVAHLLLARSYRFTLFGPDGRSAAVLQERHGSKVAQSWTLPQLRVSLVGWRGGTALVTDGLNSYAVILGGLPDGISPEQARRELAGSGLAAKLAVVSPARPWPAVAFHNAHGRHGAAPATGLATLAALVNFSPDAAGMLADGHVTIAAAAGPRTVRLPRVSSDADGMMTIRMPEVVVRRLDPAGGRR